MTELVAGLLRLRCGQ